MRWGRPQVLHHQHLPWLPCHLGRPQVHPRQVSNHMHCVCVWKKGEGPMCVQCPPPTHKALCVSPCMIAGATMMASMVNYCWSGFPPKLWTFSRHPGIFLMQKIDSFFELLMPQYSCISEFLQLHFGFQCLHCSCNCCASMCCVWWKKICYTKI